MFMGSNSLRLLKKSHIFKKISLYWLIIVNNITEEYKLRVKGSLKKSDKTVKVVLKDTQD